MEKNIGYSARSPVVLNKTIFLFVSFMFNFPEVKRGFNPPADAVVENMELSMAANYYALSGIFPEANN